MWSEERSWGDSKVVDLPEAVPNQGRLWGARSRTWGRSGGWLWSLGCLKGCRHSGHSDLSA